MKHVTIIGVFLVVVGVAGLLAYGYDTSNKIAAIKEELQAIEKDSHRQELRYISQAEGLVQERDEFTAAITAYEQSKDFEQKNEAFDKIVVIATRSSAVDANNPLQRRTMDEMAGALNRRALLADRLAENREKFAAANQGVGASIAEFFFQ